MLIQLIIGGIMLGLSITLQALGFDLIIKKFKPRLIHFVRLHGLRRAAFFTLFIMQVTLILVLEMWLWALCYLLIDGFSSMEESLYFSISAFTTVGFGDILLPHEWRLLGVIEAACGFLMFGWSTAFIFEAIAVVYRHEPEEQEGEL